MQMRKLTVDEQCYIELLAHYALLTGIKNPDTILSRGEFSVEGSDFRLALVPQTKFSMLCVWCDFGEIPEGMQATCYLELLNANTVNYDGMAPMMALCPDTGLVVCSARLPLAGLTAQVLHDFLCVLAKKAEAWRHRVWQEAPALDENN